MPLVGFTNASDKRNISLWTWRIGIRDDEAHKALKDAILFNGKRHELSLDWKEG